jgi:replicative DNA helicase
MTSSIQQTILSNLIHNEEFCRKVSPFLKQDYFTDHFENVVFKEIQSFFVKYNKPPTNEILKIQVRNTDSLNQSQVEAIDNYVDGLNFKTDNMTWLVDSSEKFCKDRALCTAILDSISIIEGKSKNLSKDAIPTILSDALAVSFDTAIGHDYIEDYEQRYEFYTRVEEKIPFDLSLLNKITKGGLSRKTLNVILAGTGVGKSLAMCHVAASTLMQGFNVLYITLEMAEERIAERIDANLMNMTMEEISSVQKDVFENRFERVARKTRGKLIIKEYPTASAHSGHFQALLEELKMKRKFLPDMIIIDYLNICASSRLKPGAGVNSYTYVKSIAEEIRGLAVKYNVPILSATQTTRGGYDNTDVGLTDTSESFGLPATVDFMFALISTEELENLNQIMVKQLKNRYNDPSYYKRFVVGVDRARMKLYDVEDSAQKNISDAGQDSTPVFDKSDFAKRMKDVGSDFNF